MRKGALAIAVLTCAALPGTALSEPRDCGTFRATSFNGSSAHVGVSIYTGQLTCRTARRVLRYSITHREVKGNSALGSPKGWNCARGGLGLHPTAAGYSCEARNPRRIVTGRYLY